MRTLIAGISGPSRSASQSASALELKSSHPDHVTLVDADVGDRDHLKAALNMAVKTRAIETRRRLP